MNKENKELVDRIYQVTEEFRDPINNKILDKNYNNLSIICNKDKAIITITINPDFKTKYDILTKELKSRISEIEDISNVNIILTSIKPNNDENLNGRRKFNIFAKNILAIASGKGGVGKSTFAVNIALALKEIGNSVGILDADIYGPSIPRMMGISSKPETDDSNKLIPLKNYDIKCMSIGFLLDVDTPAIWRGPMVMKALEQMYNGVQWGNLDYLIIDLPPGTGDAQLTLAQSSKLTGSIIISTPQDVALNDVRKGINMFKKVNVPILGIVENMSYFICNSCNKKHEIFSSGGALKESKKNNIPFLGELPIDTNLRILSDEGTPSCISDPKSNISEIFLSIAKKINNKLKN